MYSGGPSFLLTNLGYKLPRSRWLPSHLLTAFAEYTFLSSEELEIHSQISLLHRTYSLTVLSPQLRARFKWAVVRLGYDVIGDTTGNRSGRGIVGTGVHFGKNDFLLMVHHDFKILGSMKPTFEFSYARNLKFSKN